MKRLMEKNNIQIIRSSRKTLSLQIKPDGSLIVRAPNRLPEREIQRFLMEKSDWIEKTLAKVSRSNEAAEEAPLSQDEIRALADQALRDIPERVRIYAQRMGVTYGRITIRNQTTRWGSCSGTGNLNFNCLLMLAPEEVRDYVVVHELSHRRHMDHSKDFWAEVECVIPDYRKHVRWLKDNGGTLIARMQKGGQLE